MFIQKVKLILVVEDVRWIRHAPLRQQERKRLSSVWHNENACKIRIKYTKKIGEGKKENRVQTCFKVTSFHPVTLPKLQIVSKMATSYFFFLPFFDLLRFH